jgi:2'-5' RNA ligase
MPPQTLRAFVAVQFSSELRRRLADAIAQLPRFAPDRSVQWVKADNIHLTLKFLGDVPVNDAAKIGHALTKGVRSIAPFEFTASDLGCFPDMRRPRVVWAGIEDDGAQKMMTLQSAVEAALNPLGYPPEDRPFSLHITLGRVRRETRPPDAALVGKAVAAQPVSRWGTEKVDAVYLMKSELRPGGSVYTPLHVAKLGDTTR